VRVRGDDQLGTVRDLVGRHVLRIVLHDRWQLQGLSAQQQPIMQIGRKRTS